MSLYGRSWWLDVEVMEIQNSLETLEVTDGDEEKTHSSIAYHNEKLAIAFALLNTPNAAPSWPLSNFATLN